MMLKRLFGPKRARAVHSVPAGQRVYAVGDIHGRLDLLDKMLEAIRSDDGGRPQSAAQLIFLGDLVDRGPESRGVIERLLTLRDTGADVRFLAGNHDEVFMQAAGGDVKATRFLTKIGGKQTILSYGLTSDEYQKLNYDELTRRLTEIVPESHKAFLATFENYIVVGDYVFVHAGIRPGVDLESQTNVDLRWIRRDFLEHRDHHGRMVIHGHSISGEPDVRTNRMGIDTGAFASGRLTAVGLEDTDHWFLTVSGQPDSRWQSLSN